MLPDPMDALCASRPCRMRLSEILIFHQAAGSGLCTANSADAGHFLMFGRPRESLAQTRERPARLVRPVRPSCPARRGLLAGSCPFICFGGLTVPYGYALSFARPRKRSDRAGKHARGKRTLRRGRQPSSTASHRRSPATGFFFWAAPYWAMQATAV